MVTSIRQQIVSAIILAMQGISVASGYQTDIGLKVTEWDRTPATTQRSRGIDVSDPKDDHFPGTTQHQDHDLFIHLKIHAREANDTAQYLRNGIADTYRVAGLDRTWGGLARTTEPVTDSIEVDQAGQITGAADVLFKVKYRTATFNPFSN